MPDFSGFEKRIIEIFKATHQFSFDGQSFTVEEVYKPRPSKGESKTDVYVLTRTDVGASKEFKISIKQENADFLENKITAPRAKEILGPDWSAIITKSILSSTTLFASRPLIYKRGYGHTEGGSITLGWKFELMNKGGGELSGELSLDNRQIAEVYKGSNLSDDKKNACVGKMKRMDSGVANYILTSSLVNTRTIHDVTANLIVIDEFIANTNPKIYFACKALNYRSLHMPKPKWDGDRPLAVYVEWKERQGKLLHEIVMTKPLQCGGHEVAKKLVAALTTLGVNTTIGLDGNNVADPTIIWQ